MSELINDTQRFVAATQRGYPLRIYDDGYGPLWILRDSMGIVGIVRAQSWEDAYEVAEDELFPEADETIEEMEKEFSTIYRSGRELWYHDNPGKTFEDWKALSEEERNATWPGRDVPFTEGFTEHPCWQEAYGFRPNGPNHRDKINHGVYRKDLDGEALDRLTVEMLKDWSIELTLEDEE